MSFWSKIYDYFESVPQANFSELLRPRFAGNFITLYDDFADRPQTPIHDISNSL